MKSSTQSKRKWIIFFSFVLIYALLVAADAYSTYLYTPDLTMEGNALVSVFGYGWKSIFIEDIIVIIVYGFLIYFPIVYYKRTVIPNKGFLNYISLFSKQKMAGFIVVGWLVLSAGIASRLYVLSGLDQKYCILCLLKKPHTYCNMAVVNVGNGRLVIPFVMFAAVGTIVLLSTFLWILREYKINKKALENAPDC